MPLRKLRTRNAPSIIGRRNTTSPSICIIGGGMAAIAAGVKLVEAGFHAFTIFEKSEGLGGTWWVNRYPGSECDVPSHLYSYGFFPYDWSRSHADRAEIQEYLETVAKHFAIRSHFQFGTTVQRATWNEEGQHYDVELFEGEHRQFDIVVSAVGMLSKPVIPSWPGLADFTGPAFHTSRWDETVDLHGKRVAVVGTGSTAVQVVAQIAPIVGELSVFQREPGWVLPKQNVLFSAEDRATLRRPSRRILHRTRLRVINERGLRRGAIFHAGSKLSRNGEVAARQFIDQEFSDRDDVRKAVTPSYPYPGKRPVFHSTFYATLKRANVQLVPQAVTEVTTTGVVDAAGVHREIDVLVLATGFQAANYLADLEIVGRDGHRLHDVWAGEPQAFLGVTVPQFPNFFMLYGPNTNGGEIVFMLERGAEHLVRSIRQMRRRNAKVVEVRERFYTTYNTWLQSKLRTTSWTTSRNYFTSPSGRVVTQWPFGALFYGALMLGLGPLSNRFSRRTR